jgi:hypothetical protein
MARCVFCDSEIPRDDPPEHVLPKWLRRLRPKRARFIEPKAKILRGIPPAALPKQPRAESKIPTVKTKLVCKECNGHWMSDLETRAAGLLTPMILGEARSLSIDEQAFIAVWGTKTDMTWQTTSTEFRAAPLRDYRHLRIHQTPPACTRVRLGRYVGSAFLSFADHNLAHLGPSTPGRIDLEHDPPGHWAILRVGQLVFEVWGSDEGGIPPIHDPSRSGRSMVDIWPSLVGTYWPPPEVLDDSGMLALSNMSADQLPTPSEILRDRRQGSRRPPT